MNIAINGMGRIGRLLFRRLLNDPTVCLVAVNDVMPKGNLHYLTQYDSLYGKFEYTLTLQENSLLASDKQIKIFREPDANKLPWKDLAIDLVLECSGKYNSATKATAHLEAGAKKVLLSTTGTDDMPLIIFGFNQHQLNPAVSILSPGGCMTNCTIHLLYLLNSIGVESAQMNILHSYTSRQTLVDSEHGHFRRGRAAVESIIPVEIDLVHSLERLLPLQGRLAAMSTRVPVANGAMLDLNVQLSTSVSREQVNELFEIAASKEYHGIIDYTEDPIVSADIRCNQHSAVIDGSLTSVVGKQLKLIAWFDNEYGYTSRMMDWIRYWK